jgi:hypothetical protein
MTDTSILALKTRGHAIEPITTEQRKVRVLPDGRLTREDAAVYLGMKPKTLAMWQTQGKGPRAIKVAGRVFYYLNDLDTFIRGEFA